MSDTIPVVDISGDAARQTVLAEGRPGDLSGYQGHPTTVLTRTGRLLCVWTLGHGGPCGPAAESLDGGRAWTRIDGRLPASYAATHRNCPTLQKAPLPDGRERLLVFSAKYNLFDRSCGFCPLAIVYSDDDGLTWREAPHAPDLSAAMPPTGFIRLADGRFALFGQVRNAPNVATDGPADDQSIWMSVSADGLAWAPPRVVATAPCRNLCEPFALRSPDGGEIALLIRENRHEGRSMMAFSRDEGQTWTPPADTSWELTGDRHEGLRLPDGRWIVAFRDRAIGSPTYGQYMAWVGTYDDIRNGRPGQYRIHLLRHWGRPNTWPGGIDDTGYSGVELLPGGEILCTTYTRHFDDDRQSSVVCTRFRIGETDALANATGK